jgi:hypothetical protein
MQDGIEECRKLCGGHGYLNSSGLPELFAIYVPACTYEGDNVVLLLQVSMLLLFCSVDTNNSPTCLWLCGWPSLLGRIIGPVLQVSSVLVNLQS